MESLRSAVLVAAACGAAAASHAHEGHGPGGGHWHPTDAWGFVVLALLLAVLLWRGRGK